VLKNRRLLVAVKIVLCPVSRMEIKIDDQCPSEIIFLQRHHVPTAILLEMQNPMASYGVLMSHGD
jgi:hypothetical protein